MENVVDSLQMQRWYVYAALGQVALLQILRKQKQTAPFWQKIPDGFRWMPGALIGFATAFVAAFNAGAIASDAVLAGVGGILGISIPAMGIAAGLKESHIPWDGGAGGNPKKRALVLPVAALAAILMLPVVSLGCARQLDAKAVNAQALAIGRAAYNVSVIALEHLDADQAETIRIMRTRDPLPTEAEFERVKLRADRLERVRQALLLVRAELESKSQSFSRAEVLGILSLLILAIDEARADGRPVPDSIRATVVSARTLLTGAP